MLHLEGRVLGGCKLIRKIGEGGMGEVYLGEQIRVGNRAVAVKVVRVDEDALASGRPDEVEERFRREAALLGNFSHPNILPVHDSGVEDGCLYLVMQYAPDGSLADAIKGRSEHPLKLPASLPFVVDITGQVADALQYTHDRNVVHRDVKPGNVLIRIEPDGHWHALLADFGVARAMETSTHKTQVTGTLAYMAPEQFNGRFSPATDQYALAVMTFQLLAGRVPFEGELAAVTAGHMYEPPPSIRVFNPNVPAGVEAVVMRGLAKEPAQRFPSVAAFANALRDAAAGKPVAGADAQATATIPPIYTAPTTQGAPPEWPAQKPPPRQRSGLGRTWVAVLAAVVLLIALVGGGGLLAQRQQQLNAQAAQTATASTVSGRATASASAVRATRTAAAQIPTATAQPTAGSDVTSPPPAPDGVAATPALSDLTPTCDGGAPWVTDVPSTKAQCRSDGWVTVTTDTPTNPLGCIEQQTTKLADGYASVLVNPDKGRVVLGFRESLGQSVGDNTFTVLGYYFLVDPSQQAFQLYKTDDSGKTQSITSGSIGTKLAEHFALGVLFKGDAITLYVNGQQVGTGTDSTYTQEGWMALCTEGDTAFRAAQLYPLS
jgi:eukaryotic-like serine/threonine-protein kinase